MEQLKFHTRPLWKEDVEVEVLTEEEENKILVLYNDD